MIWFLLAAFDTQLHCNISLAYKMTGAFEQESSGAEINSIFNPSPDFLWVTVSHGKAVPGCGSVAECALHLVLQI